MGLDSGVTLLAIMGLGMLVNSDFRPDGICLRQRVVNAGDAND
ncbi:hypothetical protein AAHA48_06325 [Dickeya oryzae]